MGPRAERPLGSGMSHRGVQAAPGGQRPRRWAERARTAQEPGAQGAGRGKCAASRVPFSQWPSGTRLTSSGDTWREALEAQVARVSCVAKRR